MRPTRQLTWWHLPAARSQPSCGPPTTRISLPSSSWAFPLPASGFPPTRPTPTPTPLRPGIVPPSRSGPSSPVVFTWSVSPRYPTVPSPPSPGKDRLTRWSPRRRRRFLPPYLIWSTFRRSLWPPPATIPSPSTTSLSQVPTSRPLPPRPPSPTPAYSTPSAPPSSSPHAPTRSQCSAASHATTRKVLNQIVGYLPLGMESR